VVANTADYHMNVYRDGKLFAHWPISSGKPGDETPNGTYLTIEKANPVDMVGPGYNIEVPWSVCFTWSGDYLHDAYLSVGDQGFTNVSHGCVNMSPADAETFYKMAAPGDPVKDHRQPTRRRLGQRLDDVVPVLEAVAARQRPTQGGAGGSQGQQVRQPARPRSAAVVAGDRVEPATVTAAQRSDPTRRQHAPRGSSSSRAAERGASTHVPMTSRRSKRQQAPSRASAAMPSIASASGTFAACAGTRPTC
jgi:L,D-transpeptidase catalytic domain